MTRLLLKAMEGRRYQDPVPNQQIRVDHNSNLTLVRRSADDAFEVEFAYTTSYGALGVVKVEGNLLFQDPAAGAAADEWGRTRNLPPTMAQEVHGAIMGTCVPEAVGIAKTLRLPSPIPIPQVRFGGQPEAGAAPARPRDTHSPEIG